MKLIKTIKIVLVIALIMRIALPTIAILQTHDERIFHRPDSAGYIDLADNLLQKGSFSQQNIIETNRTPGYPLFLVPGVSVSQVEAYVCTIQILLSMFSILLIYKLACLLSGRKEVALLAALLYALDPLSLLYNYRILAETLYATILLASVYLLVKYLQEQENRRMLILSSLLLGISVYVRPIGMYLPFFMSILMLTYCRVITKTWILKPCLIGLAVFFLTLSPWYLRNYFVADVCSFSTIGASHLYHFNAAAVKAQTQGRSYYEVQREMGYGTHNSDNKDLTKEAFAIFRDHPSVAIKVHLKGIAMTLLDPGAVEYMRLFNCYPEQGLLLGAVVDLGILNIIAHVKKENPGFFWLNMALGIWLLLYLIGSLVGVFAGTWTDRTCAYILMAVVVYLLILSGGPAATSRFRVPLMPFICIFASQGLHRISASIRSGKKLRG